MVEIQTKFPEIPVSFEAIYMALRMHRQRSGRCTEPTCDWRIADSKGTVTAIMTPKPSGPVSIRARAWRASPADVINPIERRASALR